MPSIMKCQSQNSDTVFFPHGSKSFHHHGANCGRAGCDTQVPWLLLWGEACGFSEAPEKSLLPLVAQAVTEKETFEVSLLSLPNESSQKTSL